MANPNLKENKLKRAIALPFRGIIRRLSPISYVKLQYHYITHHKLNLKNPVRYTEKLQYLRLFVYPYDQKYSDLAGRVLVREHIKNLGYEHLLIPIYGVFDKFDDIDFNKLPNKFVMKCSHASGFNEIVLDKNKIDLKSLKMKFDKYLRTDKGKIWVERHYSHIKPQIIIEKYLEEKNKLPTEYKIHVFNGKAKYLYVVRDRGIDIRYDNLYIDWTRFDGAQFNGWKSGDITPEKPQNFDELVKIAENIAKDVVFCRVDLFDVNGKIYFNEMTFTPAKGTLIFDDDNADFEIGKWLDISEYLKKK